MPARRPHPCKTYKANILADIFSALKKLFPRGSYHKAVTANYRVLVVMHSAFLFPAQSNQFFSFDHLRSKERSAGALPLWSFWKCRKAVLPALAFFALVLTGCGGSSDHPEMNAAENEYTRNSNAAVVASGHGSISSSFTVNPTKDFKGFNAEEWNNQQSWVECNCGNNKPLEPQIMTWNPEA